MRNVMIAEDDLLMADLLEDVLVQNGYAVCGIARTVAEGVELAERCKPDLAVLDVRLADGGFGMEIAARMGRPGRPGILYATGNVGQSILTKTDGEACLCKPYRPEDIIRGLAVVQQIVATGMASGPFPRGFTVLEAELAHSAASPSGDAETAGMRRLRRQQAALARFGSFALGEPDLGKVLTEAARVCAEGLEVAFCKVCRYRAEENDLLVEAGVGWHQGVIGRVVSRADGSSPQGRAFVTGEPMICSNIGEDASFVLPAFYAEHRIISTVDVVIRREGQPWGVLEIDNPVQHDYDQHDIDFLTGFANVLGEAVNTSKRNAVLQSTIRRMEEMVADRDRLLAAKNLALTEKNILLEEKSRLLDEKNVLAQELQHRVRNNLQLVHAMLDKQLQVTTDAASKEGVGAIARRVMALAQVYDHLLGTGLSRTIDFGGYLSSLCSSIESVQKAPNRKVVMTCQAESVTLDLDSVTALGLVVSELMSNSYDHAFPGGTGTINVSLVQDDTGRRATLVFSDDGIGFAEGAGSRRHGVGLVRRLIQQVGGSAELLVANGSKWTLKFPLPATAGVDTAGEINVRD